MSMYLTSTAFITARTITEAMGTADEDEAQEVFAALLQAADGFLEVCCGNVGSRDQNAAEFQEAAQAIVSIMDGEAEREIALAFASALVAALQAELDAA
jgi:hypothetical protein